MDRIRARILNDFMRVRLTGSCYKKRKDGRFGSQRYNSLLTNVRLIIHIIFILRSDVDDSQIAITDIIVCLKRRKRKQKAIVDHRLDFMCKNASV